MKIGIVDFGAGNVTSLSGAIERVGHEPILSDDPIVLAGMDKFVLPGVGAFGNAMSRLRDRGLVKMLEDMVLARKVPMLGICLGAQLMCRGSEEFGYHEGLGFLDASVVRLRPDDASLRIPHVGWNDLFHVGDCPLFEGIPDDSLFYYTHSYQIVSNDPEIVCGEVAYGGRVTSVLWNDNLCAVQFHPEKSQMAGLTMLANFIEKWD